MASFSRWFGERRTATAVAIFLVACASFLCASAPAQAALGHSTLRTFSTGPNSGPQGIATDGADNVYVAAAGGRRIEKFDSTGNPVPFSGTAPYIDGNVLTGTSEGPFKEQAIYFSSIAVDHSGGPNDGDIYVIFPNLFESENYVSVFDSTGIYKGRLSAGPVRCGVSVGADGSVYLGQGETGGLLRFAPPTGQLEFVAADSELRELVCVNTVDSEGAVYVQKQVGDAAIEKFPPSQFDVESPTPTIVFGHQANALALDPTNGDLYGDKGSVIVRWDATGAQQGGPFGKLNNSFGLAIDNSRDVYASDAGGGIFVFSPDEVQLPTGITGGATNVSPVSADVEGSVDPDGAGNIIGCEFRYGEDTGYSDGSVPCTPGTPISGATSVGAHLEGLVSGTTYHYRLFVTNANGTEMSANANANSNGVGDETFTTPPATEGVTTGSATEVKRGSAVLNGSYVGDGQDVHYFFEWGKSTAYGHTTPAPPGDDAGTGTGPQNVAPIQVSGLEGGVVYHYRLVVSTASGITRGGDETFTTETPVANLTADPATGLTDHSADLHASFDGDGTYETRYYFEWGQTTAYGNTAPSPPGNAVPAGTGRIEVPPVTISGLEPGATYHFRVVASNVFGSTVSGDQTFTTADAPGIGNLNTRNVAASSAELTGEVNPHEADTTYFFEWGPSVSYGNTTPVPPGEAGAGNSPVAVAAQLEGLTTGVIYHFRLVASNQYGTTVSPDQSFGFYPPNCPNAQLRQETRSDGLPDCRAYELVTPTFAQGAIIMPSSGPTSGVATNPARIAYGVDFGLFDESTGEAPNSINDLFVSTRSDTGWSQRYIGLPTSQGISTGGPLGATGFSQSVTLSLAALQRGTQASPSLDRIIDYSWGYSGQSIWYKVGSNAPYVWDSSSGALLDRWPTNLDEGSESEHFVGIPQASTDFSHFVFSSNVVFAPGGEPRSAQIGCCTGGVPVEQLWPRDSVYDNDLASGTVALASVREDGSTFQGRVFDISDDGSHILMTEKAFLKGSTAAPPVPKELIVGAEVIGPLYLRVDGARTYEIAPGRKFEYAGSTADGSTVYLTSKEQLTPDDHDTSSDLFVWHESDPHTLTRVSVGTGGSAGNSNNCAPKEGWTSGCNVTSVRFSGPPSDVGLNGNGHSDNSLASKNGDIYFESPEQLVGQKGKIGERNLYLYRAGSIRYVATLRANAPISRMQVTADGKFMALVTASALTEYDSGGQTEMYLYGADGNQLVCVSCRPDNQAPAGPVYASQNGLFLTNDGRAFFSTKDPLVPRDTNAAEDVYEYTEAKPQLITQGTGAGVELLSLGNGTAPGLVSVSANGTDVYFATIDNLVTQDHNGAQIKIYDARTGGGFPAERDEPKCTAADECHGPSSQPAVLPPDRTSANLGQPGKHKAGKKKHRKHHKHKHHKRGRKAGGKQQGGKAKHGGKRHG